MIEVPIIRNACFWEYVPFFIKKDIHLKDKKYRIIGYFPYHTARIKQQPHQKSLLVPRLFLTSFENILEEYSILDNKAVYICESLPETYEHYRWAIMLKDEWSLMGSWEDVVDYEGHPLKCKK